MDSNDPFDSGNPPDGLPSPLVPTSNVSVRSQSSSNPMFTPRATTRPEDSDSEYGAHHPIHTPVSSMDDAPRYEDLPPTYEQVQAIARSEQESVLNRSGHFDARVHELDSAVDRMALSDQNLPIPSSQGRNVSRDNIPVDDSAVGRGHDIPVYQLPSYDSISGADHQSTTSQSSSSVDHRQNLLARALEFTKNEPDADARFAPRLARKIAVPPLTHALDIPTQFARTYAKSLHAHSISPAEFAEFVDGINIICTVEGFSPSTSDLFDTEDSLLAAYVSGANEAFFGPRGLKVSVRTLKAVLAELEINGQSAELNEQLLKTITSIVGDPKAKIDVLNHATESLDFNVPEPASRSVTLRTWAQGLVAAEYLDSTKPNADQPANTNQAIELPGSEPTPAFELPGSELVTRSNTTSSNNNNSWAAWGENFGQAMGKWGMDFGKRMEKWGEEFGNESAKRGMAFGENINRRAEEMGRRFGGEGSRGCGSRSGIAGPGPMFNPLGRGLGPFGGIRMGMGPGRGGFGMEWGMGGPGAGPWGRGGWHHHHPHASHRHPHASHRHPHAHPFQPPYPHPHQQPFIPAHPARNDDDNESISSSSTLSSASSSSSSSLSSLSDPLTSHAAYLAKVTSITTHHKALLANLLSTTPVADIEAARAKARQSVKRQARAMTDALRQEYVAQRRDRKRGRGVGKGKGVGKEERREEKRRAREERREVKRGFKARRRDLQMWKREALRGVGGVEKKDKCKGKGKKKREEKGMESGVERGDVGVEEVWLVVENLG